MIKPNTAKLRLKLGYIPISWLENKSPNKKEVQKMIAGIKANQLPQHPEIVTMKLDRAKHKKWLRKKEQEYQIVD